ncbi:metaxin-2-like [Wyeomyia smithii]|uniref:metaxin-2-like n=1 Tax=Wyeomyia smithii TaxID=174621 RepID=UPI002467E32C|nr:metaxin-2-like [Wyeomyia smithii]
MSVMTKEYLDNLIASEPWPQTAYLYQPYEEGQILLAENASCLAVRTYLRMLELPFNVEQRANAEFISPGGKRTKLPVLRVENFTYAEFGPILSFVEQKKLTLTGNLSPDVKDDIRTNLCLVEHIFTNAEQYISWLDPQVRNEITKQRNGCVYPFPLNHIQNWRKQRSVCRQLNVAEYLNLKLDEVVAEVDKLCISLSSKLDEKTYFYGDEPTELDALVFGHLFSIFTMTLPNNVLAMTINKYKNLTTFCKNVEAKYFKKSASVAKRA